MIVNENLDDMKIPGEEKSAVPVDQQPELSKAEVKDHAEESVQNDSVEDVKTEQTDESIEPISTAEEVVAPQEKEDSEPSTEQPEEPAATETPEIDYDFETPDEEIESEESEDSAEETEEDGFDGTPATLYTIDEIVAKLREIAASEEPQRKAVDEVKNQFYRLLRTETETQKTKFIEDGGEELDFVAEETAVYTEGKELIKQIKEKRAQIQAKEEAVKEQNVAKKLSIIEQIKELTENPSQEDFNKTYQEFKTLQQQWNDIKLIPQAKANELWKTYQTYVEKFYDLVRINNEFREYDFKKNYEMKTELCEAAERLEDEPDEVSAFHQLQNLHQQWREIGPVARKDREEIWSRFKEASNKINRRYQSFFEKVKEQETQNLNKKIAICEKLEAIDYSKINLIKDWRNQLREVTDLQAEWRKIGYVPRKWNSKIYDRYRAACDAFFGKKNDFYKSIRDEMDQNLLKKTALCEQAESMKDSRDWRKTTQDMIRIQREWKEIGPIPKKYVDSLWQRFITACDYFFEQKKLSTSSQLGEELKNLEAKKKVIEQIRTIDTELSSDEAVAKLRELMDEWQQIGHVPFKQKDKIYSDFYEATETQFNRLNIDKADRKLENFKVNLMDMAKSDNAKGQILRERERLMRQYERMKTELQTYENNIGFLSVASKKGNNLVDDMNQKVKKIKSELDLIIKKIDAIDKEL